MLLGYLIIRAFVILVKVFDRLPSGAGRGFARALNAATTPFDLVNYPVPTSAEPSSRASRWLPGSIA